MAISASMVKDLREKTGAGMMDCKKALEATNGEEEAAVAWLREKGLAKAAKKAGRATSEGLIGSYISQDGKVGVLLEVKCETDFVAKNDKFQDFVVQLAKQVAGQNPSTLAETDYQGGQSATDALSTLISVLGENMQLGRFARLERQAEGGFGLYVHANGKIGVLVEFACPAAVASKPGFQGSAKDVAMQVAAVSPICVSSDQVPADLLAREKEIYKNMAMEEGKPEAIAEKVVIGRIQKYYKDVCLLEQPFIKEDKKSVGAMLKEAGKALGGEIKVNRFVRMALGEDVAAEQE
jgi:elongation factor Ts